MGASPPPFFFDFGRRIIRGTCSLWLTPCTFVFLQDRVEQLLQSCHFNPELLAAPLTEAAGRGHVEVTQAGRGSHFAQT